MEELPDIGLIVAIALPFLLLQLGLMAVALVDLIRRNELEVAHLPKWGWAAIIVLLNFIGPIAYLIVGRKDGE